MYLTRKTNFITERLACVAGLAIGCTGFYFNLYQLALYILIAFQLAMLMLLYKRSAETKEMNYRLDHDELTDLLNRKAFNDELKGFVDEQMNIAVLFIDLDGFKTINDTFGHNSGDLLLISAASRVKNSVRPYDKAFRLGGDEMAVIITNLERDTRRDTCIQIADRIIAQIGSPYNLNGTTAGVTCSVGIAFFPENGTCPEALVEAADSAMYKAKNNGKNSFVIYGT